MPKYNAVMVLTLMLIFPMLEICLMTMYDKQSRLDKAFRLIEEGKVSQKSNGVFTVLDSKNLELTVDLANQFHDNCADFVYNCGALWEQPCKHILAAQLYQKTMIGALKVR